MTCQTVAPSQGDLTAFEAVRFGSSPNDAATITVDCTEAPVAQQAEAADSNPAKCWFESIREHQAPVVQLVEALRLERRCSRFESVAGYK